jgi:hypothetical protein
MTPLRRLVREERGFTLVEVLVSMVLMFGVLDATLLAFNQFQTLTASATTRQDNQDRLRTALDRLSKDLRGISGSTSTQTAIDNAGAYDLMFLSVDPTGPNSGQNASNLRRVRYCVDNSHPANEVLWFQTQTWTTAAVPTAPSTTSCPDPAWGNQTDFVDHVTNEYNGQSRPAFTYNSASRPSITTVHADVYLNVNGNSGPPTETHLSTGVFLRNQVLAPVASFTADPQSNYRVILNGAESYDPQGQDLVYVWYDGATKVGNGQTLVYQAGSGGTHTLSLKVYDPAGLEGDAASQVVTLFQ